MNIVPITYKTASEFVNENHRHHSASQGCKFCLGLTNDKDELIGVAICGRPVARKLDDGFTLEINRLCTLGQKNACSMLYGACSRVAKDMGYKKIITYILESENGASLKTSNFILEEEKCGGINWTSNRKQKEIKQITLFGEEIIKKQPPEEMKKRYVKYLCREQ